MMKVNDSQRIANLQNAYGVIKGGKDKSSGGLRRKDEVSISSEALELLQSHQISQAERGRKLEELKSAVQSGTYYVDAGKLAERLLPFIK